MENTFNLLNRKEKIIEEMKKTVELIFKQKNELSRINNKLLKIDNTNNLLKLDEILTETIDNDLSHLQWILNKFK